MRAGSAARAVAVLAAIGFGRIAWFHLVAEDVRTLRPGPTIDAHYAPLRRLLPASGVVGYVSDEDCDERPGMPVAHEWGCKLYQQAQYAVAPVVLKQGDARRAVVVVNVVEPAHLEAVLRTNHLHLVALAGDGMAVASP